MQRSRQLLQNAASKAAAAKSAGGPAAAVKHLEFVNKLSFDEKTTAQILSTSKYTPPLYKPLYHHLDPLLLKSREPGSLSYLFHHLQSSLMGFYSICTSQQSRDDFLRLTARKLDINVDDSDNQKNEEENAGIINTLVLNQSDMGFMKVMTLYQDLSNPIFDEINFNTEIQVKQFLEGCSFALEQFHTAQAEYLKQLEATLENIKETEDSNSEEGAAVEEDEVKQFQNSFFDTAENDHESVQNSLTSMLSPEGLDRIFFDSAMYSLVANVKGQMEGSDESVSSLPSNPNPNVMNSCLLSARVEEIEGSVDKSSENEVNDPDAPLEDESLQSFADRKAQTVLQLEVLYDLEIDDTDKSKSFKSVNVAKFETCIKNNPNGDELQWRLCSWRPANEFGHL